MVTTTFGNQQVNANSTTEKPRTVRVNRDDLRTQLDLFLSSVEEDAYRLALAACKDSDEALDLVQESMMQLVKRYSDKPDSEWPPLFHRILQNRIRDWYRRKSVKHALLRWSGLGDTQEQIAAMADENNPSPESLLESNNHLSLISSAIAKLPLRQQQVFLLRAWQGMNVEETARAMQISTSSVKTHYSRATTRLREQLD